MTSGAPFAPMAVKPKRLPSNDCLVSATGCAPNSSRFVKVIFPEPSAAISMAAMPLLMPMYQGPFHDPARLPASSAAAQLKKMTRATAINALPYMCPPAIGCGVRRTMHHSNCAPPSQRIVENIRKDNPGRAYIMASEQTDRHPDEFLQYLRRARGAPCAPRRYPSPLCLRTLRDHPLRKPENRRWMHPGMGRPHPAMPARHRAAHRPMDCARR